MGSKGIRRAMLSMIGMFLVLAAVIVFSNLDTVKKKLGIGSAEQTEASEQTPGMEDGGQIGNDLSAFVRDETFFDPEVKFKSIEMYSGKRVSMTAASAAGDLYIFIENSVGELAEGAAFTVELQGVGEYTDEDEDGIIYIDQLKPGEYSVSLKELEGYSVPDSITTIQVKDELEYKKLDYVDYLIRQKKDVKAEKEDSFLNQAAEDADGTENTRLQTASTAGKTGIDVSEHNGEIDWKQVKEAVVSFAMIRCGYRGTATGVLVEDSRYEENIKGALGQEIPVGIFFETQAVSETEAVEEASMVLGLIRKYDVDYPVFLKCGPVSASTRTKRLDDEDRTRIAEAFLKTVSAAGYETGICAAKGWLEDKLDSEALSDYNTWLAEYSEIPSYDGYYHMWQYTSRGTVPGILTDVDLDVCYMKIDTSVNHAANAGGYSGVVNGNAGNVPTQ